MSTAGTVSSTGSAGGASHENTSFGCLQCHWIFVRGVGHTFTSLPPSLCFTTVLDELATPQAEQPREYATSVSIIVGGAVTSSENTSVSQKIPLPFPTACRTRRCSRYHSSTKSQCVPHGHSFVSHIYLPFRFLLLRTDTVRAHHDTLKKGTEAVSYSFGAQEEQPITFSFSSHWACRF